MVVKFSELSISTGKKIEIIDLTKSVVAFIRDINVNSGICIVNSVHTTAAILINENESGLNQDVLNIVTSMFPPDDYWLHNKIDNNASAHIASTFLGNSKILPVRNGQVVKGEWQSIFLLELDGPRTRTVLIEFIGE
ncbi:MAG TPA: secondary thiamine-phosphate synthase enzyme YjbQ [Nitrososphaerales archaeon]